MDGSSVDVAGIAGIAAAGSAGLGAMTTGLGAGFGAGAVTTTGLGVTTAGFGVATSTFGVTGGSGCAIFMRSNSRARASTAGSSVGVAGVVTTVALGAGCAIGFGVGATFVVAAGFGAETFGAAGALLG